MAFSVENGIFSEKNGIFSETMALVGEKMAISVKITLFRGKISLS